MSRPYGPIPLTAGIVTFQDIDPGAAWVVIENSSLSFDVGVCFQVNPPPVVTSFSGPPYDGAIQAGGWRKFQLPSAQSNQQWTGRVWLLPIDVSASQAASGTISGYARVYLTTYLPGEEPADAPTIVRALDIVSQQRSIAIPAANQQWHSTNSVTPAAVGNRFNAPNPFFIGVSALNLANGSTHAYLTNYRFSLSATAVGFAQIRVDWAILDAGLAQISSIPLFNFRVDAIAAGALFYCPNPFIYQDDLMLVYSVDVPPNAAYVALDHTLTAGTATGQGYNLFASWWVDLVNTHPIAQPGNQTLHRAPGAIF